MINKHLEILKSKGLIKDYAYEDCDRFGAYRKSAFGNSQRLSLFFHDGTCLDMESVCEGQDVDSWFALSLCSFLIPDKVNCKVELINKDK